MKNNIRAGILVCSFLAGGCSSTGKTNVELFSDDGELDSVTWSPDAGLDIDLAVDRERTGVRIGSGEDDMRGFFEIFSEDWEFRLPSGAPGATYDSIGVGGGVTGVHFLGESDAEVVMVVPFHGDMSVIVGDKSNTIPGESDTTFVYVDLHLDVGIGVDWKGLRPSVGVAVNSLGGVLSNSAGDATLTGSNIGFFVDLFYKHPEHPFFGHLRVLSGDYEVTTIGIGMSF